MSLKGLDKFSKAFVRALFAEWPDWEKLAAAEHDGGAYLCLRVPDPPGANLSEPLSVRTNGGEVTVAMDRYHAHLAWPDQFAEDVHDPLWLIRALVAERLAAFTMFSGDKWRQSSLLTADECHARAFSARPAEPTLRDVDRFRVRSWRGALDADGVYL